MAFEEIKALPAKDSQLSLVRLASPVLAKGSPSATEQALRGVQMKLQGRGGAAHPLSRAASVRAGQNAMFVR